MKKLKVLWEDKKRLWKEYRIAFLIEIIFLGIAALSTIFLIQISSKSWETRLTLMTQNVQSLIENNMNVGKTTSGKDLAEQTYMGLGDILPDSDDINWNSRFGINVEFTDESGKILYGLSGPEVGCIWITYEEETHELKREWIPLGEWFDNETNNGWNEFKEFYRQEQGNVVVKKIEGYYNGGVFRVNSVELGSSVHKYNNITINKNAFGKQKWVYRVSDLNCLSDGMIGEEVQIEQGSMDLFVYMPNQYIDAMITDKCQATVKGTINGYDLSNYTISMYADTVYLALHDGVLKKYTVPIWVIGQAVAVFLIAVALYMQKKRKELARLKNAFINAMAHEMKTPAAVIKNSAECLEEGIHPEKQEHYIGMMQKEADHMNELLMSMLAYTRISDSFYELNKTECILEEMLQRSCARYREQIEEKKIRIIWDDAENTTAICDEKLIAMVMDNFVSNAVRFCRKNGVIRFTIEGGSVSVYNDGNQIPTEQMKEIWTPMYKGDNSRKETSGTSGMGLAISAVILKAHKAGYGVHNIGEGVEFYFKLPS